MRKILKTVCDKYQQGSIPISTDIVLTHLSEWTSWAVFDAPAGPGGPYHGVGGVMNVERPRYENPMHEEFFKACENAGLPANPDFNNWDRPQASL